RAFGVLWLGALVSNIGTWMETVSIGIFVTQTTGKAGWTGTVAALMYLPAFVLGPIGGALADRFDRKRYVATGTVAQFLLAAAMTTLAFTGHLSVAAIGVLAMLAGCVSALASPAFTALLTDIVEREDLHSAFSLNSAQYNVGRVLGPMLAAPILAYFSVGAAFAVNTMSFVAVLLAIAGLGVIHSVLPSHPEPLLEGIRNGVRAAREDKGILFALSGTLVIAVLISPFIGLVPVMAIKVLHGGEKESSLLVSCQGLGAVSAALVAGSLADWLGRRRMLEYSAMGGGVIAALYWMSPRFVFAGGALFFLGAAYLLMITGLNTVAQTRAPNGLQARVSSLFSVTLGGGYAIGVLAQGWLGDQVGQRAIAVACALLFLGVVFWARAALPEHLAAMEGTGASMANEATRPVPTLDGPADPATLHDES
ncbi:MAG: MFS transporter, partial [Myxococcaceae bacterium]